MSNSPSANPAELEEEGYVMTLQFYYPTTEEEEEEILNATRSITQIFERGRNTGLRMHGGLGLGGQRRGSINDVFTIFQQQARLIAATAFHQFLFSNMGDDHLQGQPPASKEAIDSLEVFKCLSEKRRKKHVNCAICQEDFPTSPKYQEYKQRKALQLTEKQEDMLYEDVLRMPCKHLYHSTCLKTWLHQSATCPTCRYEIATDNAEYNVGVRNRMQTRDNDLKNETDTDEEDECIEGPSSSSGRISVNSTNPNTTRKRKRKDDENAQSLRRSERLKRKITQTNAF